MVLMRSITLAVNYAILKQTYIHSFRLGIRSKALNRIADGQTDTKYGVSLMGFVICAPYLTQVMKTEYDWCKYIVLHFKVFYKIGST